MKITLFLAIFAVLSFAANVDLDDSQFEKMKENIRSTQTLLIHNNAPFMSDGSGSISGVIWEKEPKVVGGPSSDMDCDLGPSNSFTNVGAISAKSTGFAYFRCTASQSGSYDVKFQLSYLDGHNRRIQLKETLTLKVKNSRFGDRDVEDVAVVAVKSVEAETEAEVEARQSNNDVSCSNCQFAAVVGENTYNSFTYSNIAGVNLTLITYTITLNANLPYTINSSTTYVPAGSGGALNFVFRANAGPTSYPMTITMKYKKVTSMGLVSGQFAFTTTVPVSCPGGVPTCTGKRSIAERAISVGESVQGLPVAYKVGAAATALVAVVAAIAAILVIRRNKKNAAPVAEQL